MAFDPAKLKAFAQGGKPSKKPPMPGGKKFPLPGKGPPASKAPGPPAKLAEEEESARVSLTPMLEEFSDDIVEAMDGAPPDALDDPETEADADTMAMLTEDFEVLDKRLVAAIQEGGPISFEDAQADTVPLAESGALDEVDAHRMAVWLTYVSKMGEPEAADVAAPAGVAKPGAIQVKPKAPAAFRT